MSEQWDPRWRPVRERDGFLGRGCFVQGVVVLLAAGLCVWEPLLAPLLLGGGLVAMVVVRVACRRWLCPVCENVVPHGKVRGCACCGWGNWGRTDGVELFEPLDGDGRG